MDNSATRYSPLATRYLSRTAPMKRTKPPFRADHVGSLLRPAVLKEDRAKRERGEITADQLQEVEDREIEKVIKKQEAIGLQLATDGEFRRSWWHFDFYRGLDGVELYRKAIRAFYDAGCRYLQLDDTAWSMICDPKEREGSKKRGDDPDRLPAAYARLTNLALAGRPADMVVTMHSCRGNFRSTFIAQGGYEYVAEHLLGEVDIDGYFLEYDTNRAGGFEPLRFVPKGKKQVV